MKFIEINKSFDMKYILRYLAQLTLWRFEPKIIALTGSAGKIRIIEAIEAVLSHPNERGTKSRIRISKGELDSEFRIILTIIGDFKNEDLNLLIQGRLAGFQKIKRAIFLTKAVFFSILKLARFKQNDYPEILVLEYEPSRSGAVKELLEIVRPFIGIVIATEEIPVRIESWSSPDMIFKERAKMIERLPANGFAILNFDNGSVLKLKERTRAKVVTFGFNDGADLRITNFSNGASLKLSYGGSVVPIVMKNISDKVDAYSFAAAACVGLIFDLNLVEISEALQGSN